MIWRLIPWSTARRIRDTPSATQVVTAISFKEFRSSSIRGSRKRERVLHHAVADHHRHQVVQAELPVLDSAAAEFAFGAFEAEVEASITAMR
jgi:hypothetical protein